LILGLITLIGVSIIVFVVSRLSGDVAIMYTGLGADEATLQAVRARFGLDKPIPIQYLVFIKNAIRGDFGESIVFNRPAIDVVLNRLPATLSLGLSSFVIGNILGVFLGSLQVVSSNKILNWCNKTLAIIGQAIPGFWLALMLMLVFAVKLHWVPTSGMGDISHFILPVASMSWFTVAFVMRITRSTLLDVMDSDYVKMARIKGNPESIVIWKHAFRNALIPVVTMAGMQLTMVIGGAALIETVFRWPGIGALLVSSVSGRDYPVIQAITTITSAAVIIINLGVDLLVGYIDPRIKYE